MTPKVQIVSPTVTAGVVEVAIELALAAAESGLSVALIDLDVNHPSVHEHFGLPLGPGYASVATGAVQLSAALEVDEALGLSVLPAGPPVLPLEELILREESELVIRALLKRSDLVLLCSPSFQSEAGYSALGLADVSVIVVDEIVPAESVISPALVELEASVIASIADPGGSLFAARNGTAPATAAAKAPPAAPQVAAPASAAPKSPPQPAAVVAPAPAPEPTTAPSSPATTAAPAEATAPTSPPATAAPAEATTPSFASAPVETPPLAPAPRTFVVAPPKPRVPSYLDDFPDAFREFADDFPPPEPESPAPVAEAPSAPAVPASPARAPEAPAVPASPAPAPEAPAVPAAPAPAPIAPKPSPEANPVANKPPVEKQEPPADVPAPAAKAARPSGAETRPKPVEDDATVAAVRPEVTNDGDGLASWSESRAADSPAPVALTKPGPLLPGDTATSGENVPLSLGEPRWGAQTGEHPQVPLTEDGVGVSLNEAEADQAVSQALAYLDKYEVDEQPSANATPAPPVLDDAPDFESLVPEDYLAGPAEPASDAEDQTWDYLRSTTVVTQYHGLYPRGAPRRPEPGGTERADDGAAATVDVPLSPGQKPLGALGARVEPVRQRSDFIAADTPVPSALAPTDVPLPPPVVEIDPTAGSATSEDESASPGPVRGLRGVAAALGRLVGSVGDGREAEESSAPADQGKGSSTPTDATDSPQRPRTLADTGLRADPLLGGDGQKVDADGKAPMAPASPQPLMKRTPAPIIRRPDPERRGMGSDEEVAQQTKLVPGSGGVFARAAAGDAMSAPPGDSAPPQPTARSESTPPDAEPETPKATDVVAAEVDAAETEPGIKPMHVGPAKATVTPEVDNDAGSVASSMGDRSADATGGDADELPDFVKSIGGTVDDKPVDVTDVIGATGGDADELPDFVKSLSPVRRTDRERPTPTAASRVKPADPTSKTKSPGEGKPDDGQPAGDQDRDADGKPAGGDQSADRPKSGRSTTADKPPKPVAGDSDRWVPPSKPGEAARRLPRPVVIPPSRLRPSEPATKTEANDHGEKTVAVPSEAGAKGAAPKEAAAKDAAPSEAAAKAAKDVAPTEAADNDAATGGPQSDPSKPSSKPSTSKPSTKPAASKPATPGDPANQKPTPTPTPTAPPTPSPVPTPEPTGPRAAAKVTSEADEDPSSTTEPAAPDQPATNGTGNGPAPANGSTASSRATARANADLLAAAQQRAARPKPKSNRIEPGPEALTLWAPPVLERNTNRVETRWFEDPVAITPRTSDET